MSSLRLATHQRLRILRIRNPRKQTPIRHHPKHQRVLSHDLNGRPRPRIELQTLRLIEYPRVSASDVQYVSRMNEFAVIAEHIEHDASRAVCDVEDVEHRVLGCNAAAALVRLPSVFPHIRPPFVRFEDDDFDGKVCAAGAQFGDGDEFGAGAAGEREQVRLLRQQERRRRRGRRSHRRAFEWEGLTAVFEVICMRYNRGAPVA